MNHLDDTGSARVGLSPHPAATPGPARPVRVVVVSNVPAPYRVPALRLLSKQPGIQLDVVYCSQPHIDISRAGNDHGFEPIFLGGRYVAMAHRFWHFNTNILEHLKRLDPDVVITTGFIPTFLMAFAWAWWRRVAHIVMTDGTRDSEAHLTPVHRWVRRVVYQRSRAFIGASQGSLRLFEGFGVPPRLSFLAPLAVDNTRFACEGTDDRPIDLLFSARLINDKQPGFALEVAAEAGRRLGRRVSLDILGDGPLRPVLEAQASALAPHVVVRLHGHVPQADLPDYYQRSKVFLFPSLRDTWGVVANEAAATGLPILVSAHAGVAHDLVVNGQSGYVLPLELQQWVQTVVTLLSDEQRRHALGQGAREAVSRYTFEQAARGMVAAISRAMGPSGETPTAAALVIATVMHPRGTTGVQTHVREFGAWLHQQGRPASVLSPFDAGVLAWGPRIALRRILERLTPERAVALYRSGHGTLLRQVMRRSLQGKPPGVIYAQCPVAAHAALAARPDPRWRVVLIVHFNESQAMEWAGKGMIAEDGPLYRQILELESEVIHAVDGLVFVSRYMQSAIHSRHPQALRLPQAIIPNFVQMPGPPGPGSPSADLIAVGTLEPRKNQRFLLDIVAAAHRIGHLLTLTIVGDGPDRTALTEQARALGIEPFVRFAGFVPQAARWIGAHRALIHVAKIENCPICVIEALSSGVPVLAVASGGTGELFDHGVQGLHLAPDDPQRAAVQICSLLADEQALHRMGLAARNRYLEHYAADQLARRLEGFLNQMAWPAETRSRVDHRLP